MTYVFARSAAVVLHFDAAVILFPVCRNLVSIVRQTPLNNVISFDENIEFHKAIAKNGGVLMWLQLNFATGPGLTGYVMLISLFIMVATATQKARRAHFNRFWYLHHLFIPFFGAWAFHGAFCMIQPDREPKCSDIASFWKYWIASGTIYIGERVLREIRARQTTYISKVVMHPSKVVEIQIKKNNITTKAGQYIFLCCPEVSIWQWHPFTLTSLPRKIISRTVLRASMMELNISSDIQKVLPRVMVDGPFGSASEDVFKFEVAMLVGAGIGVTPFASILKSIWYRVTYPKKSTKLRKVYFFGFAVITIPLNGRLRHSEVGNIHVNDDGNVKDTITGLRSTNTIWTSKLG
ncbi:unnamed protein product [Rhizophagus irregularis]|nr:unnamed protein product [Rhizophagus irregularis]